jgi:glycerol-3-phosphate dehydrogenase
MVVNATGIWAAEHAPGLTMTASRGSHLVLRAASLGWPRAVVSTAVPGHFGRFVFAIPHTDGLVHIGLTDEPAPGADGVAPAVPTADETFLLETMSRAFARRLTPADVVGRYAGLRPLVSAGGGGTADISRRHLLLTPDGGPLTIAGGKLTTYRLMARDAVDAVARRLGTDSPSRTATLPLLGAASAAELRTVPASPDLVRRYGTLASEVAALAQREPWLASPVVPGRSTIAAEFAYGVLAEGALTAEDLVERRTRLSLVDADRPIALDVARRVLDWATSRPHSRSVTLDS